MRCRHISDLASRYLIRELSAVKMAAVEAHLAECETCRAEFEAMARSINALKQPKRTFEPPDVLAAVKREAAQPVKSLRPALAGWAFAGIAAVVLAVWLGMPQKTPVVHRTVAKTPAPVRHIMPEPKNIMAASPKAERRVTRVHKLQKATPQKSKPAPKAPEPKIEYLIVYTPESPPSIAEPAAKETESCTIRVVDQDSGKITTLSIQREFPAGSEPKFTVDCSVTKIDENNDERSFLDEELYVPADRAAVTAIG